LQPFKILIFKKAFHLQVENMLLSLYAFILTVNWDYSRRLQGWLQIPKTSIPPSVEGGRCHLVIGFSPWGTRVMYDNHVVSPHWPNGSISLLGFILFCMRVRSKLTEGIRRFRDGLCTKRQPVSQLVGSLHNSNTLSITFMQGTD